MDQKFLPAGHERWHLTGSDGEGYTANRAGWDDGPKPLTVIAWTRRHIVVVHHGYTMNPGSRYSGLTQYYRSEVQVFEVTERDDLELLVRPLYLQWPARSPQKDVRAPKPLARNAVGAASSGKAGPDEGH